MPQYAPKAKQAAARGYGANVVLLKRWHECQALAEKLCKEKSLTLIQPHDDANIVAGQGTCAKELFEEVGELDYLFACVGGGSLSSGSSIVAKALYPNCKVYGVEPEAGNKAQQSMQLGKLVEIEPPKTIADGASPTKLGALPFRIMMQNIAGILTVTDAQLIDQMKFCAEKMKMVIEPTGCLGLAGAQFGGIDIKGKRVGVVITGGNVTLERFAHFITTK